MLDILDKLQAETGHVKLVLTSGKTVFGKPDCIVYDEAENGNETAKKIRFEQCGEPYAQYYGIDDIKAYEIICE